MFRVSVHVIAAIIVFALTGWAVVWGIAIMERSRVVAKIESTTGTVRIGDPSGILPGRIRSLDNLDLQILDAEAMEIATGLGSLDRVRFVNCLGPEEDFSRFKFGPIVTLRFFQCVIRDEEVHRMPRFGYVSQLQITHSELGDGFFSSTELFAPGVSFEQSRVAVGALTAIEDVFSLYFHETDIDFPDGNNWIGAANFARLENLTIDDSDSVAKAMFTGGIKAPELYFLTLRNLDVEVDLSELVERCPRLEILELENVKVRGAEAIGTLSRLRIFEAKDTALPPSAQSMITTEKNDAAK